MDGDTERVVDHDHRRRQRIGERNRQLHGGGQPEHDGAERFDRRRRATADDHAVGRAMRVHHQPRVGVRGRERGDRDGRGHGAGGLRLDGRQQRDLDHGHGRDERERERDGQLQHRGEYDHHRTHGHDHDRRPDVHRDTGRNPLHVYVAPTGASVAAGASSSTVAVTAPAGCNWTATSNQTWATITGGASGSGNGTVSYSVAANGTPSPRAATLTIAGQAFALTQAGGTCNFAVAPTSDNVPAAGGTGRTVAVTVQTGCAWTATESASWITITAGGSGSGNGTVTYSVAANTSTSQRSSTIAIGSQVVTVTQQGAACSYTITPASIKVGANSSSGTAAVTAQAGCVWTATPAVSWISITAGGSGSGNGNISYNVAANPGTGKRNGGITVNGQSQSASMAVEQDGEPCVYGLSPTTENVPAAGGNRTVAMTAQGGCAWTATPSASWITITAGGSGSGNGTISYTVAANASTSGRTGTIAAGGQLLTITQAGAACALSIAPGSVSVNANGTTGTVAVTGQTGCAWTAVSNETWITVTGGASGSGNGTVSYSIAANAGTSGRTGTVTIAGQTFTVTQAGVPCTFAISPTGTSVGAAATSSTVAVTAPGGCAWSAASNATWITVTAGGTGNGNGTVSYSIAENPNTTGRTGTRHHCRPDVHGDAGWRRLHLQRLADDGRAFAGRHEPLDRRDDGWKLRLVRVERGNVDHVLGRRRPGKRGRHVQRVGEHDRRAADRHPDRGGADRHGHAGWRDVHLQHFAEPRERRGQTPRRFP